MRDEILTDISHRGSAQRPRANDTGKVITLQICLPYATTGRLSSVRQSAGSGLDSGPTR